MDAAVLANHIEAHLRVRAATLGLTAPQGTALRELTRPMTLRELAERMSCEPSNITFIADRLEEQGYLERHPHPDDRRAKQLVLTPKGTELRERLLELLSEDSPWPRWPPKSRTSCSTSSPAPSSADPL